MAKNAFSDDSTITIPVRNLISILGAVAISSWAYFGVLERLTSIERDLESHWEEIEENDKWIDDFQPPAEVQDTIKRVRVLEQQIAILETKLEAMNK
mgnify:CR=1 FL=1